MSKIADKAGNALLKPQIKAFLLPFEYVPPVEEAVVESSGITMKFGVLAIFVGQLVLMLTIHASMQYLWELVHQLQVLNMMLLFNVEFPSNIFTVLSYFEVASGNFEEITQMIPEIPEVIIDQEELNDDFYLLN